MEELFEKIKEAYDIVEVVSNYVRLKKVGRNFVGICPFHSEKTPSFVVSPEKQIFKCFGCGEAGDVVNFYMKVNGLTFKEALLELAEKAGIYIEEKVFSEKKRENELVGLAYKVAKFYNHLLFFHPGAEEAREYFKERGLSEDTIKQFLLGFAPQEGRVLTSYLRTSKEDFKAAEELGLIRQVQDGSFVDLFRFRVIFPVFNLKGECVGFAGRTLLKEDEPKYLNTPESKIYKKSEILYGLYQAKEYIKKEKTCFLVEGYFDFLSLWEAGIRNVVATCGTALTTSHVKILKGLTEEIILLYDGDEAGKKAMVRAVSFFIKEGILPKCVSLPEGEDPDSFVRKGSLDRAYFMEKIKELTQDGVSFVVACYQEMFRQNSSKAYREIIEVFQGIEDPILRKKIAKELSFRLDLPETEILRSLTTRGRSDKTRVFIPSCDNNSTETKEDSCLKMIAQYLVSYPEDLGILEEAGLLKYLEGCFSKYALFLKKLTEGLKKEPGKLPDISDPEFQTILSDLLFSPSFENREEVLNDIKTFIHKSLIKLELKKLAENIKNLETIGAKEEKDQCLCLLKTTLISKIDGLNRIDKLTK